jgi:hypothetical protein
MRISARSLLLPSLLLAQLACGDPEPKDPIISMPTDMDPVTDMGDQGPGLDMAVDTDMDAPDADAGVDMPDMEILPGAYCEQAEDLGEIDITAGVKMVTGSTVGGSTRVGSACGFTSANEKVFKFTLSGPARLDLALMPDSDINWVMDLRAGDCDGTSSLYCARNTRTTLIANDDKTYFLVVEPLESASEGSFKLSITPSALVCLPVGDRSCAGDDLKQCIQGGEQEETLRCAAPCTEGACGGDLCENAIVVTSFPFDLEGPADPYQSSFNFAGPNTCVNPDTTYIPPDPNDPDANMMPDPPGTMTGSIATPGQDVVFKLPGLVAGQKLTVDASTALGDASDNAIFVLNTCDPMSCLVALDIGDVLSGWEVPTSGDYTVVVDRRTSSNQDIKIRLTLE